MTRFRCVVIDEAGNSATRCIDARNRDQAVLLLLAEGVTPSSIARDAPSLAERIAPAAPVGTADILQDLAWLVAGGYSVAEAAATIDSEAARRIAAGAPVGEIMAGSQGLPRWIATALELIADRDNEPGALAHLADDDATITSRRNAVRAVWIEAGFVSAATVALVAAMIFVDVVAGLALCVAIYLVLRNPYRAFRGSVRAVRHADFLLIVGRLLICGAVLPDAIRIAAADVLADDEKAAIADGDPRAGIGRALGLSAAERAIIARGDAARAVRAVSAYLARSSPPGMDDLRAALRMSLVATMTILLLWLVAR